MGTSGRSDGPNPRTPLVPSWLDDALAAPPSTVLLFLNRLRSTALLFLCGLSYGASPIPQLPTQPADPAADSAVTASRTDSGPRDRISPDSHRRPAVTDDLSDARRAITSAPAPAVAATRPAAWGHRGVQRAECSGSFETSSAKALDATLRRLDLGDLIGRSLEEVFTGLTDVVCRRRWIDR